MNHAYTEDTLAEQCSANFMMQELGWRSVLARNNADLGSVCLRGRENYSDLPLPQLMNGVVAV